MLKKKSKKSSKKTTISEFVYNESKKQRCNDLDYISVIDASFFNEIESLKCPLPFLPVEQLVDNGVEQDIIEYKENLSKISYAITYPNACIFDECLKKLKKCGYPIEEEMSAKIEFIVNIFHIHSINILQNICKNRFYINMLFSSNTHEPIYHYVLDRCVSLPEDKYQIINNVHKTYFSEKRIVFEQKNVYEPMNIYEQRNAKIEFVKNILYKYSDTIVQELFKHKFYMNMLFEESAMFPICIYAILLPDFIKLNNNNKFYINDCKLNFMNSLHASFLENK